MNKAVSDFSKVHGTEVPVAGTIKGVELKIKQVLEEGSAKSIISGIISHINSSNDQSLRAIVGKYANITSFLPAKQLRAMSEITLEQVSFDNIHALPATGQLNRMTWYYVGIIPQVISESAGMTHVTGQIHFMREGEGEGKNENRKSIALAMEGMDIKFTTYIPPEQLKIGRSVFLEKLVLRHSSSSSVLAGHDPRKPAQVPGNKAFAENCMKAVRDVARSSGIAASGLDSLDPL